MKKEAQLIRELKEVAGSGATSGVHSLREIAIEREMLKIQNKLKVLASSGNFDDDGDIA